MDLHFTRHAKDKMKFYGLSAQRVRRVISRPLRIEEGIAENTVAMMIPASIKTRKGKKTWSQEIWTMIQEIQSTKSPPALLRNAKRAGKAQNQKEGQESLTPSAYRLKPVRVISAWRYPGVSPKRNPIPEEILEELRSERLV